MKTRSLFATAFAAVVLLAPFTATAQDAKPKGGKQAAAFTAADKDGDGKLNLAEFTEFAKARMDADAAKAKFAEIDADKDGFVTKEELRAGMRGQGKKGAEEKPAENPAAAPEKKSN
ncbi:MAG: EF-hand domain pair [Lacunisphaera sp.]|nr:EF-hand domain pair [Lacunisphaera sp.]